MEKIRIQGEQLSVRQTSTMEDHTKISHIEDRKETEQGQDHLTSNVPQPKTRERLQREKIKKKQDKAKYLTGNVPLLKTRKRFRREMMEKKQHKEEYLTGKVPKLKTRERLRTEKIENKKDKAKYLTGNVPQPNTTEIYPAEKMENKQHKVNYLTRKIRRDIYGTTKTKGNITPRFIADNVLTEVMKKTTENSRRKYTKGIY